MLTKFYEYKASIGPSELHLTTYDIKYIVIMQEVITWTNVDQILYESKASIGPSELHHTTYDIKYIVIMQEVIPWTNVDQILWI